MKFLSRGIVDGSMLDDQAEEALRKYAAYLDQLRPTMGAGEQALAEISFHDAQIYSRASSGSDLIVSYVTGDLQVGYQLVTVTYVDAWISESTVGLIYIASNMPQNWDILISEVRSGSKREWAHCFALHPKGEATIEFSKAIVQIEPGARR